jgi:hypothetical protein
MYDFILKIADNLLSILRKALTFAIITFMIVFMLLNVMIALSG